jgi:hypothetical protein
VARRLVVPGACIAILLLAGCGSSSPTAVSASLGARTLPAIRLPASIPGPLDGTSTPRDMALRRPLGVIVENYDPDSRPQSGLGAASTVIETLAEGGVTRFMALYLERDAAKVGPVRSTRVYFDNWAGGFHSILAHVGGNDDAQQLLWNMPPVFNIDENRWEVSLTDTGTPLFWRSKDRAAPHNMYVNTQKLRGYAVGHGQNWAYSQAYLLHKHPAPLKHRGRVRSVLINFVDPLFPHPNSGYDVRYQYDRVSNTYLRIMGGVPHVDAATGKPLRPANVIVMHVGAAFPDPLAGTTPDSIVMPGSIGTARAQFFHDGKVQFGRWQQQNRFAPLRFLDSHGAQVSFNPGQTWIEVLPAGSSAAWSSS